MILDLSALWSGLAQASLVWGITLAVLILHDLLVMRDQTQAPPKTRLVLCGLLFGAWAACAHMAAYPR